MSYNVLNNWHRRRLSPPEQLLFVKRRTQ